MENSAEAITDFTGIEVDMKKVREVGITRETVEQLLEKDRRTYGKHNDQLILVLANYNKQDTSKDIDYVEIRKIFGLTNTPSYRNVLIGSAAIRNHGYST